MTMRCDLIVDRKDHVQYLTVSKRFLDECTRSMPEQKKRGHIMYVDDSFKLSSHT